MLILNEEVAAAGALARLSPFGKRKADDASAVAQPAKKVSTFSLAF